MGTGDGEGTSGTRLRPADRYPYEPVRRASFSVRMPAGAREERQAVVELLVDMPETSLVGVDGLEAALDSDPAGPDGQSVFDVVIDTALPHVALLERARAVELSDWTGGPWRASSAAVVITVTHSGPAFLKAQQGP